MLSVCAKCVVCLVLVLCACAEVYGGCAGMLVRCFASVKQGNFRFALSHRDDYIVDHAWLAEPYKIIEFPRLLLFAFWLWFSLGMCV